ncbi:MAG TPA: glycine cleavage system protein H [Anaeromyxobacteraceae bacterium]|nr:glycine cleavage system protein H [Anaeromyxobacteraceae bacterium]
MATMIGTLQAIGVFLLGLVARLGVLLLVMAVLASPALLWLGGRWAWRRIRPRVRGLRRAGHALYSPGARYAAGHTWVAREGGALKVGIDGVAQELLPWALAVELPKPGAKLHEGDVAAIVSVGGQDARIAAPVSGRVVRVNAEVERDPSLLKEDGYGRGWLFAVEPFDARWSTLPAGEQARTWLARESERLDRFLEERLGFAGLSARRGPAPPPMPTADWDDLTRSFLHA